MTLFQNKRILFLTSLLLFVSSLLLPVWWNTTGAYQTPIPHDSIAQITNTSSICKPLQLSYEIIIVSKEAVNSQNDIWKYESTRGIDWSKIPIDQMENQIQSTFGQTDYYRLFVFEQTSSNQLYFGHSKVSFLFITTSVKDSSVSSHWMPLYQQLLQGNGVEGNNQISVDSKTIPLRLTFSLINMDPSAHLIRWNFEELLSKSPLQHFVNTLQPFFDLQIDSQILHYGKLPSTPKYNSNTKQYIIPAKEMQTILNANDWKLISPSNNEKNIHVLFIIPPSTSDPLYVEPYHASSTSLQDEFVIPQFGSVIMVNGLPKTEKVIALNAKNFASHLDAAMNQLRILLGIPCLEGFCSTSTPNGSKQVGWKQQVTYLRKGALLSEWERDKMLIQRSQELIQYAKDSLKLTSDFVIQMRDIIVREQVVELVQHSLDNIVKYTDAACSIGNTKNLEEIFAFAKEALRSSEEAYYHPSLLALLYFPLTQRLAVFLPITLPLFITLLSALYREVKYQKNKRKEQQE